MTGRRVANGEAALQKHVKYKKDPARRRRIPTTALDVRPANKVAVKITQVLLTIHLPYAATTSSLEPHLRGDNKSFSKTHPRGGT